MIRDGEERRKEPRLDISSVNLPFLGTRDEDHSSFQYLIIDLSKSGIAFAIPAWVVSREGIKKGDTVNFHLPINIGEQYYDQGVILWTRWDEGMGAQTCGAILGNRDRPPYPVFISIESGSVSVDLEEFEVRDSLLCRVIKDTAFLKKGVDIYLGHLIPFFSRIARYPRAEYPQLKSFLLSDVKARVKEHCDQLEALYVRTRTEMPAQSDIAGFIDLEELRAIVESEVYIEIFKAAFSDESIVPYLNAIKDLENRLYFNYNTIVMLYLHSL
ncbi:MAG: PilZ domain-containing protein [Syntrophorhabdaceae bacterium]|nr:PilZ domain-containing protein [Syntrophorhabdaceae bacterium]